MTGMSNHTHHTVPTQFVEADGIRFAYRRFGKREGVPLVFLRALHRDNGPLGSGHYRRLALDREVILFDNAGISSSSGEVPTSVEEMAAHAAATFRHSDLGRLMWWA